MGTIKKIFNNLSQLGIDESTPTEDITYLKNLNIILVTYYVLFILNAPILFYYLSHSFYVIVAYAIAMILWTLCLFLNKIKKHTISTFLALFTGVAFVIYLYHAMSYRALNQLYVIVSITRIFSIFPERNKKLIPLAVLLLLFDHT